MGLQFKMDASMIKTFHVKVASMSRILKEYKNYKVEVESYDQNQVSHDKKKQEFYMESKSALEDVEKKLVDFYMQLNLYIQENKETIEGEDDPSVKTDYQIANTNMQEVKALLPQAC